MQCDHVSIEMMPLNLPTHARYKQKLHENPTLKPNIKSYGAQVMKRTSKMDSPTLKYPYIIRRGQYIAQCYPEMSYFRGNPTPQTRITYGLLGEMAILVCKLWC